MDKKLGLHPLPIDEQWVGPQRLKAGSLAPHANQGDAMSIVRVAVLNHLRQNRQTIRELLEAAYYKRFGKPVPQVTLDQDVMRWEAGENNIPYLYDLMVPQGAH